MSITLNKNTGMETGPAPTYPSPVHHPSHREGMIMNDLVTLHSLMICNALRGHIGLDCTQSNEGVPFVLPPRHRRCQGECR